MCAYDVELLHEPYALLMLPIRHNGMTPTKTTAKDMSNAVSWLIRLRRRVSDRDVVEKSAIVVVVVVAVGMRRVVCGAVIVIVSVRGFRGCADLLLWLPLLPLTPAAATGCH